MHESWIDTFLNLVVTKNITETANIMYLSQATVSSRLQSLEDYLGYKLFYRHKGISKMELTSKGKMFLPLANQFKNIVRSMILNNLTDKRINIKIAATNSLMDNFIPSFINHLESDYRDNYNFELITEHSSKIYDDIFENRIDIGFSVKKFMLNGIDTIKIGEFPFYIVTNKNNKNNKNKNNIKSLKINNYIKIPWNSEVDTFLSKYYDRDFKPYITTDSIESALHMINDNNWFIMPKDLYANENFLNDFHTIKSDKLPSYEVFLVYNKNMYKEKETIEKIVKVATNYSESL